jgi:hypothetical protein
MVTGRGNYLGSLLDHVHHASAAETAVQAPTTTTADKNTLFFTEGVALKSVRSRSRFGLLAVNHSGSGSGGGGSKEDDTATQLFTAL